MKSIQAHAPSAKLIYNDGAEPLVAAALAKSADVAIVFVNQYMSEGRDAATRSLPDGQDALVSAVAAANPHTIVVLETGGQVSMPWNDSATAGFTHARPWLPVPPEHLHLAMS